MAYRPAPYPHHTELTERGHKVGIGQGVVDHHPDGDVMFVRRLLGAVVVGTYPFWGMMTAGEARVYNLLYMTASRSFIIASRLFIVASRLYMTASRLFVIASWLCMAASRLFIIIP